MALLTTDTASELVELLYCIAVQQHYIYWMQVKIRTDIKVKPVYLEKVYELHICHDIDCTL